MNIDSLIAACEVKLIIAGGRDFSDYSLLEMSVAQFMDRVESDVITIVSGTARGADQLGERYAKEHYPAVLLERFPAEWDKYGRAAGYKRNVQMADNATHLLAFWDGKSKGTGHMINIAKSKGLIVEVIHYQ